MSALRPILRCLFVALCSAPLTGCLLAETRVNEPIPAAAVEGLAPGTTADEVVGLLGAPAEVVELGARTAYRFEFERSKQSGLFLLVLNFDARRTKSDRVWCFFDADDRLTHVAASFEAADVKHGL